MKSRRKSSEEQGGGASPWRAGHSSGPCWSSPTCTQCQTSAAGTVEQKIQDELSRRQHTLCVFLCLCVGLTVADSLAEPPDLDIFPRTW